MPTSIRNAIEYIRIFPGVKIGFLLEFLSQAAQKFLQSVGILERTNAHALNVLLG